MENKKWYLDWRSYLGILCLFFPIPIVGVILMWFVAPWSKKTKWIIFFCYIGIPILIAFIVFGVNFGGAALNKENGPQQQAADAKRRSDVDLIVRSAKTYCMEKSVCADNPVKLTFKDFSSYISYMPSDPTTTNNYEYKVLDNGSNCQVRAVLSTKQDYVRKCFE